MTQPRKESPAPHAPQAPLRIVHLVSSLKVGGMERFVLRIAGAQRRQGHHVEVLALQGGPLEAYAAELNVPVVALHGGMKSRILQLLRYLLQFRPQILNAHNPSSLHYAAVGKRLTGAKLLMTYHGQGLGDPRRPHPWEWSLTDGIVAVSQATAEVALRLGASHTPKITVIHNGIDPTPPVRSRESVREELGLSDAFTGIVVARLDPLKDHASLLRAAVRLKGKGIGLTLLIAGDGPERETLERLTDELNLQEQVLFLGFRSDVSDLLAASDFFTLPSTTEGLPLSVLESMSQGLPVVATAVGGIPEVIEEGVSGLLVPPKNPDALAAAIESLVTQPSMRESLGTAAKQRVSESFTFGAMVRQYEDLYRRIIHNR